MAHIPKCRSKVFPCPAGDRCPQHRGQAQAVMNALQNSGVEAASLLAKENLDKTEKQKLNNFLSSVRVKTKRDGSTELTYPNDPKIISQKQTPTKTVTFSITKRAKQVLPAVHPAEAVNKQSAIRSNGNYIHNEGFLKNLEQIYDGKVKTNYTHGHNGITIQPIEMPEDYRGKGVESHILSSIVVDNRADLYDFYSEDTTIPYSEYKKAGFEPNPYYWAGKTNPDNGITYPTTETLDKLADNRKADTYYDYSLHNLYTLGHRNLKTIPYIRMKHGWTFENIPAEAFDKKTATTITKETTKAVRQQWEDKNHRQQKSRAAYNPLDVH